MTRYLSRIAHGCLFATLSFATFTPGTLLADDDLTAPVQPVAPAATQPEDDTSDPIPDGVFDAVFDGGAFFWHDDPEPSCALPPS